MAERVDHQHGDAGAKPAQSLNFQDGDYPDPEVFDWFWTQVPSAINDHATRLENKDAEWVEDTVSNLIVASGNISVTYDDTNDTLTIDTSALNSEEVQDTVNNLLTAGNQISFTYDDANNTLTIDVVDKWVDAAGDTMTGNLSMEAVLNANNSSGGRVVLPVGTDKYA